MRNVKFQQAVLIDAAILHVEEFLKGTSPKYYVEQTTTEMVDGGGTKITRRYTPTLETDIHSHVSFLTYPKPVIELHRGGMVFHDNNIDLGGPIPHGVFARILEGYRKSPDSTAIRLTYNAIGFVKEEIEEVKGWNLKNLLSTLKSWLIPSL